MGRPQASTHETPSREVRIQVAAAGDAGGDHVCAQHKTAEGEISEGIDQL